MANDLLTEKVSVNVNTSTLSSIDLLVDNGYYSNRSDFINQALRAALERQQSTIDHIVERQKGQESRENQWFIGLYGVTRRELAELHARGERMHIRGYGVLIIDQDCPEDMLYEVVESIDVRGKVRCAASVKAHYGIK